MLTILDLSSPLASSDLGAADLENEFIISNLHLSQVYFRTPFLQFDAFIIIAESS